MEIDRYRDDGKADIVIGRYRDDGKVIPRSTYTTSPRVGLLTH
jgi:hypothetical protein